MDISRHLEERAWAFKALDELQAFLEDADFEGGVPEERTLIERKRKELLEGKYRVVFLGAFNVGKSALINAFLGDEYLPTILEECTTKIAHISRGDLMTAVLNLHHKSTDDDLAALRLVIDHAGIEADVSEVEGRSEINITFANPHARDLLRVLRPLTTVNAEEEFPQLRALRQKFDEVFISLPNEFLPDDVALVDSPGVHSISETNTRIANEIIPHSHVVVCLIDSQSAGNEQNRDFVEQIVSHRHRKLFFVINKSDQLNFEEIDLQGYRGPAKDLFRSLDGVVHRPETFFVSSLYGLVGAQLSSGKITLSDIDNNRKIKIPMSMQREFLMDDRPTARVATHLIEQSNIDRLRTRLLEYLYKENREGAVLESVCRFLDNRAWAYLRPLETKLELARDNPRLTHLDRTQARLADQLADIRIRAERATAMYGVMSGGGEFDGASYTGYEALVTKVFSEIELEKNVMQPVRLWLASRKNVKDARRKNFAPIREKLELAMDAYLDRVRGELNRAIAAAEQSTLAQMGPLGAGISGDAPVEVKRGEVGPVRARLAGSYIGYGILGLLVGGGLGAAAGAAGFIPPLPELAMLPPQIADAVGAVMNMTAPYAPQAVVVGAAAGKLAGLALALLLRAATATRVRRNRLAALCLDRTRQLLARTEGKPAVPPVLDQLKNGLAVRRDQFGESVRAVFADKISGLTREIRVIQEEAEALREKRRQTIARLEPKIEALAGLRNKAANIAEANAPKVAV
ncbi:MAG: dynamin family protein [Candidatus Hydrogenedentes bacterium]|nr:dynamin family protein [Candidatus Hydrogenedentota bacterium]